MNERFAASLAPALSYYAALSPAAGFQGRCAMSIPADIEGKRVLDVCCRKGKGAFALADAVGPSGYVIGVDPDTDNVAAACAAAPKNHRAGSSWEHYLRFSPAIPENLSQACIQDASIDLVYINSVLNLAWSLPVALAEFARVLAPGGRLWVAQGVFAADDLDAQGERAVIGDGADAALGNDAIIDSTLDAVKSKANDAVNQAKDEGLWDKIVGFFKDLFGGDDTENSDNTDSTDAVEENTDNNTDTGSTDNNADNDTSTNAE